MKGHNTSLNRDQFTGSIKICLTLIRALYIAYRDFTCINSVSL